MKDRLVTIVIAMIVATLAAFAQQPFDISIPSGAILYRNSSSCWSGWSEQTQARGAYVVGLLSGGTANTLVGTALTNQENRSVGQHTHTQNAHNHGITEPNSGTGHNHTETGWVTTNNGIVAGQAASLNTGSKTTGVTINNQTPTNQNSGSVTGTNVPYLQWIVCQKN